MRNSMNRSVNQFRVLAVVPRGIVALLLIVVAVAGAFRFNAAGQQSGQQSNQQAQQPAPTPRPAITMASPEDAAREMNNPRSKWFREAKYGLFIHWGLYAIPAGTWKGQQIAGIGEWIMNRAKIPVKEYEQLRSEERRVGKECRSRWAQDAGREDRTN